MSDAKPGPTDAEKNRRRNEALRKLVDEMLAGVRELNSMSAAWDAEERATAERELEAIMARVRTEASKRGVG
ncbi:MAG: hypothetical protein M3068_04855 [Gemmatimonadota bacterium]|nr:hypothetical protein [Gemmatimonadota bacterium]